MRSHEIENWARRAITLLGRGSQREDSLLELKAKWPEPRRVARQLAGHANSARGNPILWLIGVDERQGVVGAEHIEVGDWYAQVRSEFDSAVAPALLGHPTFEIEDLAVTPLAFGTDRPPYVIKNPQRESPKSGPFSLEVPWREGTNVRSAGRAELLEILSEQIQLPSVEVLEVEASAVRNVEKKETFVAWSLNAEFYFTFRGTEPLVFPFHKLQITAHPLQQDDTLVMFPSARLSPPTAWSRDEGRRILSATITATADELIIQGSGKAITHCFGRTGDTPNLSPQPLVVRLSMLAAGHALPVAVIAEVPWAKTSGHSDNAVGIWKAPAA